MRQLFLALALSLAAIPSADPAVAQEAQGVRIAAVKYGGGGDWYQGQTPLPQFISFVKQHTLLDLAPQADVVELTSDKIFSYPFLFLSGHGNIVLTRDEADRLRRYLDGGGFLYVDDDYGLDRYIRREMKKVYPEQEFVELPFSHEIYRAHFDFPNGLPKIHEHDDNAPQGFGLFREGRLVVFYTYETNLSDGWEAPGVHPANGPEAREQALRMGANILVYAMRH